jgi:hypothetical protein
MSAETLDMMKIAALVAASFINRQAIAVLAFMLLGELAFKFTETDFWFCLCAGAIYSVNATVYIKLSYNIRQALLVTGCLYWLCAFDAFLFPQTETMFYTSFGYLIGAVDFYVLLSLLSGGRLHEGFNRASRSSGVSCLFNLQLHKLCRN